MGVIAMRRLRHLIDGDREPAAKTVVDGELIIWESTPIFPSLCPNHRAQYASGDSATALPIRAKRRTLWFDSNLNLGERRPSTPTRHFGLTKTVS
jgi:hypothetical protein